MANARIFVHEDDVEPVKDICGMAVDLINSEVSSARKVSVATIYVEPGKSSPLHYHKIMEEIYYFVEGTGTVRVGSQTFEVRAGAAVFIPVGEVHQVSNDSTKRLKLISADSPPFDLSDIYYPE
jgi:mannose-6-phosphate isomerase-like protein (cupin superfamily)